MWFQYDPAASQAVSVRQFLSSNSAVHLVSQLAGIIEVCTTVHQALRVLQTHSLWLIPLNVPRGAQVQIAVPLHQPTVTQPVDQLHDRRSNTRTNSTNWTQQVLLHISQSCLQCDGIIWDCLKCIHGWKLQPEETFLRSVCILAHFFTI